MRRSRWISVLLVLLLLVLTVTAVSALSYVVRPGDTLFSIARRFNTTVRAIVDANNIANPNRIYAGQTLEIPVDDTAVPCDTSTYIVQRGDTLFSIARRYNTTVHALARANRIHNPHRIYAGQTLIVPVCPMLPPPTPTDTPESPPQTPTTTSTPLSPTMTPTVTVDVTVTSTVTATPTATATTPSTVTMTATATGEPYPGPATPTATSTAVSPATPTVTSTPQPAPPTATPTATTEPYPGPGTPEVTPTAVSLAFGGQTQSFTNPGLMRDVGMGWVKFQVPWAPGDDAAESAGEQILAAQEQGFKVLLSITGAETYPSAGGIDFAAFAEYLGDVAALGPDAIEVWNEQNIDREWPAGEISPSAYVNDMLRPAYAAIKDANPNVLVISGAPAPTGFDNGTNAWADDRYVAGMAAASAADYLDCVGIHYNAGATSPTVSSGHPGGTHYSWYYAPMVELYANTFEGEMLCFTELGYLSGDGFQALPPGFDWASATSVEEHAQWLAEGLELSRADERVMMLIVFNVDFTQYDVEGDPQAGYAMVRPDDSCPACEAINLLRP